MPLPQRKSPRLKGYDYSQEGAYFVTICTQLRFSLFGTIHESSMILNDAGKMLEHWWKELPNKFSDMQLLDYWVIMPNHFHGIVCLNRSKEQKEISSLPEIIRWFKTMTTNAYIRGVKEYQWQQFPKKLWQRSYHDRIIRNESDLNRIREYVISNPALWQKDIFYET